MFGPVLQDIKTKGKSRSFVFFTLALSVSLYQLMYRGHFNKLKISESAIKCNLANKNFAVNNL